MNDELTIKLTPATARSLKLLLSRLSFDDCLRRSDGGNDTEQAYEFITAAGDGRRALKQALEQWPVVSTVELSEYLTEFKDIG